MLTHDMVSVTSGNASVHKDRTLLTATKTDGKAKSKRPGCLLDTWTGMKK